MQENFEEESVIDYLQLLETIQDFRSSQNVEYPLSEVLFLILCAQLSDFGSLRDYELFFKAKQDFLRKFYPYKNGCPSISTMARVLWHVKPSHLEDLINQVATQKRQKILGESEEKGVLPLDGKVYKGVPRVNGQLLSTVSLYSQKDRLVIGQKTVEASGGELAVALELLETLDIKGQIITGDSAFCYQVATQCALKNKADFIFQVKGNQPTLKDFIEQRFKLFLGEPFITQDRLFTRKIYVLRDLESCEIPQKFKAKSLIKIEVYNKKKKHNDTFYYISSLEESASQMANYIRSHWCIENDLHWFLDVVFKEDSRVIFNRNFALNEGVLRRMALAAIKKTQSFAAAKLNKKHVAAKSLRKLFMGDDELFQKAIYFCFY